MKNRPITLIQEIERIITLCDACTLSMVDQHGKPYAIPMNFGYRDRIFYFHSSPNGKKIKILKNNPAVTISLSTDHELRWQSEKVACSYSMKYRSVLATGSVSFIEDHEKKVDALNIIMKQYSDREFSYNDPAIRDVCVFKVPLDSLEGRAYGY
ncbi:MAG: pyridoxamine 5'-phosphate oxidase family protein [Bacteroidetes bacterium]|nr:pyridoxamine 5'-phosphate oxidase family protein [Bacteroidota bacterium]